MANTTWLHTFTLFAAMACAMPAMAQRMQFVTPLQPGPAAAGTAPVGGSPIMSTPGMLPSSPGAMPLSPSMSPYTQPLGPAAVSPSGANPFAPSGPAYTMPSSTPTWTNPAVAPYLGPTPQATLDGTIVAPPPSFDPFAAPQAPPGTLMSQDPYLAGGPADGTMVTTMQRLLTQLSLDYYWIPGGGHEEIGVNDIQARATFAFPFLTSRFKNPFLVTPGFGITLFNGPSGYSYAQVPGSVYDAYLETSWTPQFTPWLWGEFAATVGVWADFHKLSGQSVRFPCKGVGVVALSPGWRAKLGVWYIDRARIKLLPAVGLVWTPNPDVRFDFLFPDPKVTRKLNFGSTYWEWWGYVRGEYGGGSWTADTTHGISRFDYNDVRMLVGVDFNRMQALRGHIEMGVAFNREVFFPGYPRVALNPGFILGAGISY